MENPAFPMIREVFASYKFQSKSEPEQADIIEELLRHQILTSNGVSRDDIAKLLAEQTQNTSNVFGQLSKDPLYLILEQSKPKDVLKLCQTTPRYANLCKDQDTFRRLMTVHFSGQGLTDDVKAQYQGAATGNGHFYRVYIPYGYRLFPKMNFPRKFEYVGSFSNDEFGKYLPRYETSMIKQPLVGPPEDDFRVRTFFRGDDIQFAFGFKIYGPRITDPNVFWRIYDSSSTSPNIKIPIQHY